MFDEALLEKLPPQSIEAEQGVIGACLLERAAVERSVDVMSESDFYREAHRVIWRGIVDLYRQRKTVDLITLGEWLKERNEIATVGGTLYLSTCMMNVPTAAGIGHYCGIVKAKAVQRELIKAADEIMHAAYQGDREITEMTEWAEKRIGGVSEQCIVGDGAQPIREFAKKALDRYEAMLSDVNTVVGLRSEWGALNSLLTPFAEGQLNVIAARPGMGKTAFAINLARHFGEHNAPGLLFSLEMEGEEITMRALLDVCKRKGFRTRNDELQEFDLLSLGWDADGNEYGRRAEVVGELAHGVEALWTLPVYIDDRAGLSVQQIDAEIRRTERKYGKLQWFMVDYGQLIKPGFKKGGSRAEEVNSVFRDLHQVCKEHKLAGFALSQLSRAVEAETPKRPQMRHLFESSGIENAAYRVIYLYRPAYYGRQECEAAGVPSGDQWNGLTEIGVLKQRNGASFGRSVLNFDGQTFTFRDLTHDEECELDTCFEKKGD